MPIKKDEMLVILLVLTIFMSGLALWSMNKRLKGLELENERVSDELSRTKVSISKLAQEIEDTKKKGDEKYTAVKVLFADENAGNFVKKIIGNSTKGVDVSILKTENPHIWDILIRSTIKNASVEVLVDTWREKVISYRQLS
ncbi:MAG: hypothetical protein ACE5K4_10220 [Candidatus Hydrothermarchaeota archaeon]